MASKRCIVLNTAAADEKVLAKKIKRTTVKYKAERKVNKIIRKLLRKHRDDHRLRIEVEKKILLSFVNK